MGLFRVLQFWLLLFPNGPIFVNAAPVDPILSPVGQEVEAEVCDQDSDRWTIDGRGVPVCEKRTTNPTMHDVYVQVSTPAKAYNATLTTCKVEIERKVQGCGMHR